MADPRRAAAKAMAGSPDAGYDVVIVCCSGVIEAGYWKQRLEASKGKVLSPAARVYSVDEDWKGGAGNGLGTLYAYQKGCAAASAEGFDLDAKLQAKEVSVAIYHTAGKGTRLAPLPGSENNNKPGVKLPATIELNTGGRAPITILEAVIKQTALYAPSRRGRLSVFWGDQVFVPSEPCQYAPGAHVDLLAQMLKEMPSADVWQAKGLQSYGLAVILESGEGCQIEKVDHATASRMLSTLGQIQSVGPSLGSFSVSGAILSLLMSEYAPELERREGQLDTDPHFWMPMTLPRPAYLELMAKKKVGEEESGKQWDRMRAMLAKLDTQGLKVFGAVDVGENAFWWDYGQLTFYSNNNLRLCEDGEENEAYRDFFSQPRGAPQHSTVADGVSLDAVSSVSSCELHAGSVKGSALCNVTAGSLTAERAIIVNVTAKSVKAAPGSICYNVVDTSDEGIVLGEGEVLTTVFGEDGTQTRMKCKLDTDGKEQWSKRMEGNPLSFEEVHARNKGVDPVKCEQAQMKAHDEAAAQIGAKRRRAAA
eukprot:TRINITY_DN13921_c0_g1_i2.p1 TRINITY_DN13921_c0_g1~~TRINITY_DN13921_c0_g1_i2.p1  ORF type:complete len:564 (+),score=237.27 TRINITY_DN13921_c0_g1_i2:86-1693(+)